MDCFFYCKICKELINARLWFVNVSNESCSTSSGFRVWNERQTAAITFRADPESTVVVTDTKDNSKCVKDSEWPYMVQEVVCIAYSWSLMALAPSGSWITSAMGGHIWHMPLVASRFSLQASDWSILLSSHNWVLKPCWPGKTLKVP